VQQEVDFDSGWNKPGCIIIASTTGKSRSRMSGLGHFLLPTQAATNEATSRVSRVAAHVRDAVHICIVYQAMATYLGLLSNEDWRHELYTDGRTMYVSKITEQDEAAMHAFG
jgi:hypothetical protein